MQPRIQYAKTSDGVSIAFYTVGQGQPFVQMPGAIGSAPLNQMLPGARRWMERLSAQRTVVRYYHRGFGQSQHDVDEFSLEAWLLDLEAVVDHMRLERFVLCGVVQSGPLAVTYAARHPDRVSHLILYGTGARGESVFGGRRRFEALQALADADWELYSVAVANVNLGGESGELARRYAAAIREYTTPQSLRAANDAICRFDVTAILPQVQSPTLVLYRTRVAMPGPEEARLLASRIPGAQLVALDGDQAAPYVGDTDAVLAAIEDFLGEAEAPPSREAELPSGTAIILFADIVDSTALTERLGDAAFRAKARELDGTLRSAIREASGTPVEGKLLGDGVLAVFTSARQAIEAALRCASAGEYAGLPLHLGLHAGDIIREEDPDGRSNVYGGAVNIASRISALSAPGKVLVSETVRSLARTSAGVMFEDCGEQELKGVGEAVRVWRIGANDL